MPSPFLKHSDRLDLVKVIQRLEVHVLSQENVSLDPVRQKGVELVAGVFPSGDGKDVVELFERSLFCFCKKDVNLSDIFFLSFEAYLGGGRRS